MVHFSEHIPLLSNTWIYFKKEIKTLTIKSRAQGLAFFALKDKIVNILDFEDHVVTVMISYLTV